MKKSLSIEQQAAAKTKAQYLKKMTIANYLPTLSLVGGIYKQSDNANLSNDSYNQIGLKISMPLFDINRGRTIELRQLDYLKSNLELQDTQKEEEKIYQKYVKKVEFLGKKVNIVSLDAKLYDSLLNSTQELYEAGEKTSYDVENLRNSKQTMLLDKKIYKVEIQQTLLELYAKMHGKI